MTKATEKRAKKKYSATQPALTVTLKFSPEERIAVLGFIAMLNSSDDGALDSSGVSARADMGAVEFCKRAVFYSMKDAQRRAAALHASTNKETGDGELDTVSQDAEGTLVPAPNGTDSTALADAQGN